jgi:alcohol oxidase
METTIPLVADIIIAGGRFYGGFEDIVSDPATYLGGAAGCVVAGRLAKAHPKLEILLIEAGSNNRNNPNVIIPSLFVSNLDPNLKVQKFYDSKTNSNLADRAVPVMFSHILGGGSSINFMMYSRPLASDFDDWNADGWAAKDMVPLFKNVSCHSQEL